MISSLFFAYLYCCCISILYVGVIYFFVPKDVQSLPRNDPKNIKYRMIRISLYTIVCLFVSSFILDNKEILNASYLQVIGLHSNIYSHFLAILITFILMIIFYFGPILSFLIIHFNNIINTSKTFKVDLFFKSIYNDIYSDFISESEIILIRNLLLAPITEEIVFRALSIPSIYIGFLSVFEKSSISYSSIALMSSAWFGIAHIHHLYEKIKNGEKISLAILSTIIQFTYTTIFGVIASYLFMRTGSIFSPIVSHIFCNFMGLPNTGFYVKPSGNQGFANPYSALYPYRWILTFIYIAGLAAFSILLFPMTERLNYITLYTFS